MRVICLVSSCCRRAGKFLLPDTYINPTPINVYKQNCDECQNGDSVTTFGSEVWAGSPCISMPCQEIKIICSKNPHYLQNGNSGKIVKHTTQGQNKELKANCYQWQFPYIRIAQSMQGRCTVRRNNWGPIFSRRKRFDFLLHSAEAPPSLHTYIPKWVMP
jgi:hypothetical protein